MSDTYIALVTGAASGIGFETSRQFIEGNAIVIGVDINETALRTAGKTLGDRFVPKVIDIGDPHQIQTLFTDTQKQFGQLDALINNAGKVTLMGLADLEPGIFDLDIGILLKGPMLLAKHFFPLMQKSSNPCIVNIASTAAIHEIPKQSLYAIAKAGLIKFTQSCVHEMPGIRSNCILPGLIETPILKTYGKKNVEKLKQSVARQCPCGRAGRPEDIANAILFLCSDKATYINGTSIEIDGGMARKANIQFI